MPIIYFKRKPGRPIRAIAVLYMSRTGLEIASDLVVVGVGVIRRGVVVLEYLRSAWVLSCSSTRERVLERSLRRSAALFPALPVPEKRGNGAIRTVSPTYLHGAVVGAIVEGKTVCVYRSRRSDGCDKSCNECTSTAGHGSRGGYAACRDNGAENAPQSENWRRQ